MRISDLGNLSQTSIETIRYYERTGLLQAPARSSNNYRVYKTEHLEQLMFIRHCRNLDMSLKEIANLLELKRHPQASCKEVNALLDQHIEDISQRMQELESLKHQMEHLRSACGGHLDAAHCGILKELDTAVRKQPALQN